MDDGVVMNVNSFVPDAATGEKLVVSGITDKSGYAARWMFSKRHIDNLLAQGLPHLRIGNRRVRIEIGEADAWMRGRFGTQRRGRLHPAAKAQAPESAAV
jgi:hypothetical protein